MSLIEVSLSDVVKKQYAFKLRAFFGVFSSLAVMQILSILMSLGGVGSSGFYGGGLNVNSSYYSGDLVVGFTMLWAFISGILITTKAARYDDFTFVANRVSSNTANALFLLVASIIGGATSLFSGFLLRVLTYFFSEVGYGTGSSLVNAPIEFLIGILAAGLYILLCSALGYFIGMLIQVSKVFVVLLPTLFVGTIFFSALGGQEEQLKAVFNFFFTESSLLIFFIKIIVVSGLLFLGAAALSNKMEVRS